MTPERQATNGEDTASNGLKIGYGKATLSARGITVVVLIGVLANIAAVIWSAREIVRASTAQEQRATLEHSDMTEAFLVLGCVVSSDNETRTLLRRNTSPIVWDIECPGIMGRLKRPRLPAYP